MAYDLSGKHVLVTGASSGIGAALAIGFAERGATIGICARRADRLEATLDAVRKHAPESRAWTIDLADLDGIAAFAASVSADLGGVDVLVNNAGIPKRRGVEDLDAATVEAVMSINYFSPVRLTLALLPDLIARSGRIVNISSVAARLSPPHESCYAASKAALSAFMESTYVDLAMAGHDVGVHLVNPGVIDTELFHLPDNEKSMANIEGLPVEAIVEPVVQMMDEGTMEIFVPDWFAAIATSKAGDVGGFLKNSVAWAKTLA
jgi:NAD(P)-dependent dehydrogenase (short-subunit alcohol dehydrogenase family)